MGDGEIERLRAEVERLTEDARLAWSVTNELREAQRCVSCRGTICPPMQCGSCIEKEAPAPGMPQRPATTNLRERLERAERERDEACNDAADAHAALDANWHTHQEIIATRKAREKAESDRAALLAACEAMAAAIEPFRNLGVPGFGREAFHDLEADIVVVNENRVYITAGDIRRLQAALATYARARGEAARGESED